jgi:hypothetical protein
MLAPNLSLGSWISYPIVTTEGSDLRVHLPTLAQQTAGRLLPEQYPDDRLKENTMTYNPLPTGSLCLHPGKPPTPNLFRRGHLRC